jgi:hypothetical protein
MNDKVEHDAKKRTVAAQIISEIPEHRKEVFDTAVHMTMESVRRTFPEITDNTVLGKFCECVARIVSGFAMVPVSEINNVMDSMFSAYIVASAAFEGLIDIADPPEKMKKIIDDAMEKLKAEDEKPQDGKDNLKNTGLYL